MKITNIIKVFLNIFFTIKDLLLTSKKLFISLIEEYGIKNSQIKELE